MVVEETVVCVCEYCCFERITLDNNTDDEELQHFLRAKGRNILLFYFIFSGLIKMTKYLLVSLLKCDSLLLFFVILIRFWSGCPTQGNLRIFILSPTTKA